MDEQLDDFDHERDIDDVLRIWRETNWYDGEDRQEATIRSFFEANDGRSVVGRIDGHAESVVHRTLGSMNYQTPAPAVTVALGAGGVTAVTTSRIGRKRGLASRLTARTVAHLADEGADVAILGMFEQGFYDRFGFGNGAYENTVWLYPGSLDVPVDYRTPERFDFDTDGDELHAAVVGRMPYHGSLILGGERSTSVGLQLDQEVSLYGYRTDGAISHFMAVHSPSEHGPDRIIAWAYQNQQQCLELLRLVQEWGDQVDVARFAEPGWLPSQDLVRNPGHEYRRTKGGAAAVRTEVDAWWQFRINNLDTCTRAMGQQVFGPTELVVELTDPIAEHLEGSGYEGSWQPLTGTWRLSINTDGGAERIESAEPQVRASVGAFSRWWLGVLPASTLAATGQIQAAPAVLDEMDGLTAHLPAPQPGWDF